MKAICIFDSFKGSLSSAEAGEAAARALASSGYDSRVLPLADGGEGMAATVGMAKGADRISAVVSGPLGSPVEACYYYSEGERTAWIDLAAASGITLSGNSAHRALRSSTFGTGELMLHAMRRGATTLVVGLGGSATTDAGLGALAALGVRVILRDGSVAAFPSGEILRDVADVDISQSMLQREGISLLLPTDVEAPLCGRNGAARVFAPQKGASEYEVEVLEQGLEVIAALIGSDAASSPGSGAAGGAGAGFSTWGGGRILSGAEYVIYTLGLDSLCKGSSLVLTGEGHSDRQTLMGKGPAAILRHCRQLGIPCALFSGGISDRQLLLDAGFAAICDINASFPDDPLRFKMRPEVASERIEVAVRQFITNFVV